MTKRKGEKPLKGNPNQITRKQHVIPKAHLDEWENDDGGVYVYTKNNSDCQSFKTDNQFFCVDRLWDQNTEGNILKKNEDNYQSEISHYKESNSFNEEDNITGYYLMLCVRTMLSQLAPKKIDTSIDIESIDIDLSKEELERYEMLNVGSRVPIIFPSKDAGSQVLQRTVMMMLLNSSFSQIASRWETQKWHIYKSSSQSFVLSDAFYKNYEDNIHILPITPHIVLIADNTYQYLSQSNLLSPEHINQLMTNNSQKFYIRKDLPEGI